MNRIASLLLLLLSAQLSAHAHTATYKCHASQIEAEQEQVSCLV